MTQPWPAFFVAGGSLRPGAASYIERRADRELLDALSAGEFCYVLTARQTGKSSLMIQTAALLRQAGARVAAVELTALGQNLSPEQWYYGLLTHLAEQIGLEDAPEAYWSGEGQIGPLQRFMRVLCGMVLECLPADCQVVIFLDEIDAVRSLPFSTDELFAAVRELHNRRALEPGLLRLTFCLLGVATPTDLIADPRTTPFNVGRRIDLEDFTFEEALPLAVGFHPQHSTPRSERPTPNAQRLLRRVLYWTGGHPYLTQRLCKAVAEGLQPAAGGRCFPVPLTAIDRICADLFMTPRARVRDDNLLFIRDRLLRAAQASPSSPGAGEDQTAGLLDLYRVILAGGAVRDDDTGELASLLRLSGLVRGDGGRLRVRNRIYARVFDRRWIRDHLPEAEARRQRAAFYRGLARATAAGAVVTAIITGLALRSMRNEAEARRLARSRAAALGERDLALRRADAALEAARRQRGSALQAGQKAVAQYLRAEAALAQVDKERRVALAKGAEARRAGAEALAEKRLAQRLGEDRRRALVQVDVAEGIRLVEDGNPFRALPLFSEALSLDAGRPERQRMHRLRIGSILRWSPRLVRTWSLGHPIHEALFSPDRSRLLVMGEDGGSRVWDTAAARPLSPRLTVARVRNAGADLLAGVAFSSDASSAYAIVDGEAWAWSARGTPRPGWRRIPLPRGARAWLFGGGGRYLAGIVGEAAARVFDTATAAPFGAVLPGTPRALSGDGRRVVLERRNEPLRVWDVPSGRPLGEPLTRSGVPPMCFDASGGRLLIGGPSGSARLWSGESGRFIVPGMPHDGNVGNVIFSPDGRLAATASDDRARIWDTATGRPSGPALTHRGPVGPLLFSPDSSRLLTATSEGDARLWDPFLGRPAGPILPHAAALPAAAFSPDGSQLLTVSRTGVARVWDLRGAQPAPVAFARAESEALPGRGRSHLGGGLAILPVDQSPRIEIRDADPKHRLRAVLHHPGGFCWELSSDGRRALSVARDEVRIWAARTGRLLGALRHPAAADHAEFDPAGRRVVTTGADTNACIWDVATGRSILTLRHPAALKWATFSGDGRLVATLTPSELRVWEAETGELLTPPLPLPPRVSAATFAADGRSVLLYEGILTHHRPAGAFRATLPAVPAGAGQVARMAELLSGERLDRPGSRRLTAQQEMAAWAEIAGLYRPFTRLDPDTDVEWHRTEAGRCERAGEWRAAVRHLDAALRTPRPAGISLYEERLLRDRRARALAELEDWQGAAAEFGRAAALPGALAEDEPLFHYFTAVSQLAAGNHVAYAGTCRRLLGEAVKNGDDRWSDLATWSCALGAPDRDTLGLALQLVTNLARRRPKERYTRATWGALLFRAGRWAEALAHFRAADELGTPGPGDELLRAMTEARLGLRIEALARLRSALRRVDEEADPEPPSRRPDWAERAERALLRAEAVRVIRP
jgi:WD40 repeat protein